ncbi:hypothetical protein [Robiginitalea marina]|uniref:Uncharacterized protein n=1 Tax=Robiginitalea marina TaxID=2954105 RepID=A0ABT1AV56_9FLAO|nr:hypothetical protein [Robiginitalea marina]MCO5723233.1 hypothetical protein [Robiginitalea marina]
MKTNFLKKLSILFITVTIVQTTYAQTNSEEVDLFQSIFGMQKKEIVAEFLNANSDDAFWGLYDEYENKRKAMGKERLSVLIDYVENYNSLNNDKYDEVVANMISLRKGTDKLIDQYYKKIKKASGSKRAAQFFQIENYFLSAIRTSIFEGIPYIGQFDN